MAFRSCSLLGRPFVGKVVVVRTAASASHKPTMQRCWAAEPPIIFDYGPQPVDSGAAASDRQRVRRGELAATERQKRQCSELTRAIEESASAWDRSVWVSFRCCRRARAIELLLRDDLAGKSLPQISTSAAAAAIKGRGGSNEMMNGKCCGWIRSADSARSRAAILRGRTLPPTRTARPCVSLHLHT